MLLLRGVLPRPPPPALGHLLRHPRLVRLLGRCDAPSENGRDAGDAGIDLPVGRVLPHWLARIAQPAAVGAVRLVRDGPDLEIREPPRGQIPTARADHQTTPCRATAMLADAA